MILSPIRLLRITCSLVADWYQPPPIKKNPGSAPGTNINLVTVVRICLRSQISSLTCTKLVPKQVEGIVWSHMLFDL